MAVAEHLNKILNIAWLDLRQGMRNYRRIFIGTAAALILISFLAMGFKSLFDSGQVMEPFTIAIVNQENSKYIDYIIEQVKTDKELNRYVTFVFYDDVKIAQLAVQNEKVLVAIIIPADFLNKLFSGQETALSVYAHRGHPVQTYMLTNILNNYFNMFVTANFTMNSARDYYKKSSENDKELDNKVNWFIMDSMYMMTQVRKNLVLESSLREDNVSGMNEYFQSMDAKTGVKGKSILVSTIAEYYFVVVVFLFILFISVAQGGETINEINNGLSSRIIISGASWLDYMAGKFIGGFLLTFGQSAILLFCAMIFFYKSNPKALPLILLTFLATVFLVNALSFLLALLFNNTERFTVTGNILVFIMSATGGGLIPVMYLPDKVYYCAWLTPHYWGIDGITSAISGDNITAWQDIAILMAIGLIYTITAFCLASRKRRILP